MRAEISRLLTLGPLTESASGECIREQELLLKSLARPATDEEAIAVVALFAPDDDDCYGLTWSLVHFIESAPGWPLEACLRDQSNEWVELLRQRLRNAGLAGEGL